MLPSYNIVVATIFSFLYARQIVNLVKCYCIFCRLVVTMCLTIAGYPIFEMRLPILIMSRLAHSGTLLDTETSVYTNSLYYKDLSMIKTCLPFVKYYFHLGNHDFHLRITGSKGSHVNSATHMVSNNRLSTMCTIRMASR